MKSMIKTVHIELHPLIIYITNGIWTNKPPYILGNIFSRILATGHNCRIVSVAALEGDAQYFIIWNIGDHCLNFSINMIRFEKVGG